MTNLSKSLNFNSKHFNEKLAGECKVQLHDKLNDKNFELCHKATWRLAPKNILVKDAPDSGHRGKLRPADFATEGTSLSADIIKVEATNAAVSLPFQSLSHSL